MVAFKKLLTHLEADHEAVVATNIGGLKTDVDKAAYDFFYLADEEPDLRGGSISRGGRVSIRQLTVRPPYSGEN